MRRLLDRWLPAYAVLYIVFLYLPVIFLPIFSVNASAVPNFPLSGFTTHWYSQLASTQALFDATHAGTLTATGRSIDRVARSVRDRLSNDSWSVVVALVQELGEAERTRGDEVTQPPFVDEEQPMPLAHRSFRPIVDVGPFTGHAVEHLDAARTAGQRGPDEIGGEARVEPHCHRAPG